MHKIIIQGQIESQAERKIAVSEVGTTVKVESQMPKKPANQGFLHIETEKSPRNEMVYIVSTTVDDCDAADAALLVKVLSMLLAIGAKIPKNN